jgi:16S rRNA C1402 N4-methylase RsmH
MPVCVLDLATGTGSNIRYLMDRLPRRQRWLAVDRDAALLADLRERMSSWGAAQRIQRADRSRVVRHSRRRASNARSRRGRWNLGALGRRRSLPDVTS